MVRYVFNCWRGGEEMLLVRRQFYHDADGGDGHDGDNDDDDNSSRGDDAGLRAARRRQRRQQQAVARVSMWMTRQHCSHMVESTALLTAALLSDEAANNGWSTYAVRATYAAAFSRFVTGLLDGHQDKLRKQSMYAVAKKIGLPASFVELRHQSTHEQLPSRAKLRSMAAKALAWIWDYYWKNLPASAPPPPAALCRAAVVEYLQAADDDDASRRSVVRGLARWPLDLVLATVAALRQTLPGNQVYIKCLQLSKELVAARPVGRDSPPADAPASGPEPHLDAGLGSGWALYEGPWRPKPIGLV